MSHWSQPYVGIPYIPGVYDCADMCAQVCKDIFGKKVDIPRHSQTDTEKLSALFDEHKNDYLESVISPRDGDIALMLSGKQLNHIGIFFKLNQGQYILHNHRAIGSVVVDSVLRLRARGLRIEGYYRLKNDNPRT